MNDFFYHLKHLFYPLFNVQTTFAASKSIANLKDKK